MTTLLAQLSARLQHLQPAGSTLILACSGGSDSQVMLDLVGQLKLEGQTGSVVAVGVDHGLRPEAKNELKLAGQLAQTYDIPFNILTVTLPSHGNLLENARDARYAAIRQFAQEFAQPVISTAHTATDQCETLIQRLSRGTGLRGAGAIREQRGDIIRPLLGITRGEVLAYANSRSLSFASDPSNLNRARTRTRIREDVVPVLSELNPEAEKHWSRFATRSALATDFLNRMAQPLLEEAKGQLDSLNIEVLKKADPYLREWALSTWLEIQNLPVENSYIKQLGNLLDAPGKKMTLGGKVILNEANYIWGPAKSPQIRQQLAIGEQFSVPALGGYLKTHIEGPKKTRISQVKGPTQVAFDADRLHLGLEVRPWQAGDRFEPFGLKGSVKIGDLFTNLKIPNPLREHWPLVVCGEEIIWVVGLRRGAFAPMSKTTTHVLYVEYVGSLVL